MLLVVVGVVVGVVAVVVVVVRSLAQAIRVSGSAPEGPDSTTLEDEAVDVVR